MIFKNVDDDKNEANVIIIKKEDVKKLLVDNETNRMKIAETEFTKFLLEVLNLKQF